MGAILRVGGRPEKQPLAHCGSHEATRRRYGATGHELYRSVDDPNELTVVNHFPSKEQAEAFAADPSLKVAMERGGVISEPRITWARETEVTDYKAKAA